MKGMSMSIRNFWMIVGLIVVLVGCQPSPDTLVLPTVADMNMLATDDSATAMAIASPTREPLPPTFTPSPLPSATATDPASVPTTTPEGFRADGTLYYIFNGNSIIELAADRSFEDLLPIPHIGQEITGLRLSPNDAQLAYIAPGAGSAREIYVTDRKGTNTRPVSQLGFGIVQTPVWKPDSSALAFIAAQGPESPRSIYVVNADGSGLRPVLQLPSLEMRDLAWSLDGEWLFYSNQTIYAVNVASGAPTETLTQLSGYGPDVAAVHNPVKPELYYLKGGYDRDTGQSGGVLAAIDTSTMPTVTFERSGAPLYVDHLEYSRDGAYMLISGSEGIWVQDQSSLISPKILQGAQVPPLPTFKPDGQQVAYINLDGLGIPQIFVIGRAGGDITQITFHQEGTISDLNWAAG
jgi:hypothetical protein